MGSHTTTRDDSTSKEIGKASVGSIHTHVDGTGSDALLASGLGSSGSSTDDLIGKVLDGGGSSNRSITREAASIASLAHHTTNAGNGQSQSSLGRARATRATLLALLRRLP